MLSACYGRSIHISLFQTSLLPILQPHSFKVPHHLTKSLINYYLLINVDLYLRSFHSYQSTHSDIMLEVLYSGKISRVYLYQLAEYRAEHYNQAEILFLLYELITGNLPKGWKCSRSLSQLLRQFTMPSGFAWV